MKVFMTVHKTLALAVALLCGAGLGAPADTFTGRVVATLDGDTLGVLRATPAGPREQRVRLWGIDAPEKTQAYGARSKDALSRAAHGRTVTVDVRDRDRYGRLVAVVTVGALEVNAEQVRAGLAWWYARYAPHAAYLSAMERDARRDRRGLWADPAPVPPWEYRKAGHAGASTNTRRDPAGPELVAPSATVYVTRTGAAYHRPTCRYAGASAAAMSRSEALRRGLRACKVCTP